MKQSWFTTILTTLYAFIQSIGLIITLRPQVIICNGPGNSLPFILLLISFLIFIIGTCVPLCLTAFLLRVLVTSDSIYRPYIIFSESYCRVQSLSLTGKLLYPFVDKFIVQWESLFSPTSRYPKVEYLGKIC